MNPGMAAGETKKKRRHPGVVSIYVVCIISDVECKADKTSCFKALVMALEVLPD